MTLAGRKLKTAVRRRGYTLQKLALHAGVCRTQFSQVLSGARAGGETRKKVSIMLEPHELELLGWPPAEPEYSI